MILGFTLTTTLQPFCLTNPELPAETGNKLSVAHELDSVFFNQAFYNKQCGYQFSEDRKEDGGSSSVAGTLSEGTYHQQTTQVSKKRMDSSKWRHLLPDPLRKTRCL